MAPLPRLVRQRPKKQPGTTKTAENRLWPAPALEYGVTPIRKPLTKRGAISFDRSSFLDYVIWHAVIGSA